MKIKELFELLSRAVQEHGYQFYLGQRVQHVPVGNDFVARFAYCVRCNISQDVRSLYPVEVAWHCFYRDEADREHVPGTARAFAELGLGAEKAMLVMAAGEEYHLKSTDVRLRKQVRAVRNDLLAAAGLEELWRRPLPTIAKR